MQKSQEGKTKGQIEAEISNGLIQFEREYLGRGPVECKTYLIDDMVLIRLKGVLTQAEQQLAKNDSGKDLIKKMRSNLLEQGKGLLTVLIEEITSCKVVSLHTDISTKTGERIIIFTMGSAMKEKL